MRRFIFFSAFESRDKRGIEVSCACR